MDCCGAAATGSAWTSACAPLAPLRLGQQASVCTATLSAQRAYDDSSTPASQAVAVINRRCVTPADVSSSARQQRRSALAVPRASWPSSLLAGTHEYSDPPAHAAQRRHLELQTLAPAPRAGIRGGAAPAGPWPPQPPARRMAQVRAQVDDIVSHVSGSAEGGSADADAASSSEPRAHELAEYLLSVDVEAILFETGVLKRLQPRGEEGLRAVAALFQDPAAAAKLSVRQCINVLSSCTLLGQFSVPLHDAVVRRCTPELAKTDPEAVGSLCYILGIGVYASRPFCRAVENLLVQRSERFSVRALAKAVYMLGKVQYNNEAVAGLVDTVVQRALADDATPSVRLVIEDWSPPLFSLCSASARSKG
jgi:hypothetical protein